MADPGFPRGGGANPFGGGRQHMILPNFPTNCMKLKEFGPQGRPSRSPLDPPPHYTKFDERTILRKGVEGFF